MARKIFGVVLGVATLAAAGAAAQSGGSPGGWQNNHSVTLGQDAPQGPTGPRTGDKVSFCGKVVALVEMGCVGIVGAAQTVELSSVTPKPAVGDVISGVGTINTQGNVCMQGLHMGAATYKAVASCD